MRRGEGCGLLRVGKRRCGTDPGAGPGAAEYAGPVPVMILGRLAVDHAWQGRNLGGSLLRDAIVRTLQAAEIGGIRAILVDAISEGAKRFYERHGFRVSPVDPMILMITVADAERALSGK